MWTPVRILYLFTSSPSCINFLLAPLKKNNGLQNMWSVSSSLINTNVKSVIVVWSFKTSHVIVGVERGVAISRTPPSDHTREKMASRNHAKLTKVSLKIVVPPTISLAWPPLRFYTLATDIRLVSCNQTAFVFFDDWTGKKIAFFSPSGHQRKKSSLVTRE